MTDADRRNRIKKGLGITGTYQDDTIDEYITETMEFMKDAGVKESVVTDAVSVGCIMRGVADLWNLGNGNADFSPYFKQRVIQLTFKPEIDEEEAEENVSTS